MQSTSTDLLYDIRSSSSVDEDISSISSFSSNTTAVTTPVYTSKQLELLLVKEKQKFRILRNESKKSSASWWRSFGYPAAMNEKDEFEKIPGFISCFKCCHTSIYGFNSGTKRFILHANRCFPLASSCSSISDLNNPQSDQLTLNNLGFKRKLKLTEKEQNDIKELYAKWVCEDLRPYSIIEDKGFEQIAQMFIRIGAHHGLVDVKDLLRSRQTVARTVNDLALKYRADLKDELVEPLKSKSVTIIPDFWTNKYNQQTFLGLNITFVTHIHVFKSVDLFCLPFYGVKSYDLILKALRRHLCEYGIIDLTEVNIMTDRGANFVKAFASYNPLYCFGHRLNNILKVCFFQQQMKKKKKHGASSINDNPTMTMQKPKVIPVVSDENSSDSCESDSSELEDEDLELYNFNEDTLVKFQKKKKSDGTAQKKSVEDIPAEAKKILLLLKQTKKLVTYVKQSGLNQEIKAAGGTTLHQACVVRWLSLSDLLFSVINSFKITKRLLFSKQKQQMINNLDEQGLKQLLMLLKPFTNIITIIQCGNGPSLHLVSMCYITLKEVLSSYELLKNYNKENFHQDREGENSKTLDDDDLEDELPGIRWFRERLLLLLKEMFILDIRHVVATLLHPRYRSLKKIPDHVKNQCYIYVRRQVRQLRDAAEVEEQFQNKSSEPPNKKFKNDKNIFSRFESENFDGDFKDDTVSGTESDEFEFDIKKGDELDRYLLFEFDKNKQNADADPLQFWKTHRNQFPFLSKYARSILSIPATTTNVEREFSTAGWVLNQRRTNLKPEEVDKILFVRSIGKQLNKA